MPTGAKAYPARDDGPLGKRGMILEKRKVTIRIDNRPYTFYSNDPDEYIADLERRANLIMKETGPYAGPSSYSNAMLSVISLTDELLRKEAEAPAGAAEGAPPRKTPGKKKKAAADRADDGQISVWDVLQEQQEP